jgi:hypothetical protein
VHFFRVIGQIVSLIDVEPVEDVLESVCNGDTLRLSRRPRDECFPGVFVG